jgi:hypothetical protein
MWKNWKTDPPEPGMRVCVVADDGCSARLVMTIEAEPGKLGALDAEDGDDLLRSYPPYFEGAIWAPLPDDYGDFMFMSGEW